MVHTIGPDPDPTLLIDHHTRGWGLFELYGFGVKRGLREHFASVVGIPIGDVGTIGRPVALNDPVHCWSAVDGEQVLASQDPTSADHFTQIGHVVRVEVGEEDGVDVRDGKLLGLHGALGAIARVEEEELGHRRRPLCRTAPGPREWGCLCHR